MNLTVEEALAIHPLSEGRLVAGKQGVSRVISSINLMDAPDVIDWMKEGELLLTTAFAIKDSPDDFVALLHKLNDRGCSGLGIKLGRYWSEIPAIALREADRLHFPLIELPFAFTFSEQINALFQTEFRRNTQKLSDLLETQKRLVDFAMRADEYTNYFRNISDILQHPLAVVGAGGQLLYNTTGRPPESLVKEWPWPADSGWHAATNLLWRTPLLKNGKSYGFLLVQMESASDCRDKEGIFHQAAVILSYHLEQIDRQRFAAAGERLGRTMERYLQGQATLQQVRDHAEALDGEMWGGAYLCVAAVPSAPLDAGGRRLALGEAFGQLLDLPPAGAAQPHHFFVHDHLISLIPLAEDEVKDRVISAQKAHAFGNAIASLDALPGASCYVSKIKRGAEDLMEGYRECMEARAISGMLGEDSPVVFFPDLEMMYLLRHIPSEVMAKYCSHLFRPFAEKEEEYAAEMMRTLEAYVARGCQVNEAAKELFIHRNTVLYRLEKIGELLGLDLKNTDHLLQIKLALTFRRLLALQT